MGGIRACFNAALVNMYDNGAAFSYLYPFSTAYYRKFGYEMCCERIRYQLKLSDIRTFALEGNCQLAEQGNLMAEEIKKVYEVWQNKYNMMVINEDWEYAWTSKSNPVKDQAFTYVYKTKGGDAKAFMTFKKEDLGNGRNLRCSRFFFTDPEGLKGLLNLLHSLASDHLYVYFELPTDLTITPLLPEWSLGAGKCEKVFWGMVRVVNVEKVLRIAKYCGDGSLIMQIKDDFIPQNNGSFFVHFKNGNAVEVCLTDRKADISLGINDFSRLIVGVCSVEALEFMDNVSVSTDPSKIAKVFYKKPNHITEYF
jgi:predicted acetyltransferase